VTPRCLQCGFPLDDDVRRCPKCDAEVRKQTDGSRRTIDVAHREETVAEALEKLRAAIHDHRAGRTQTLRVVVGQGLIRDAVTAELESLRRRRVIVSYAFEPKNRGALLVKLKRSGPRR
jgi:hypothetical protein